MNEKLLFISKRKFCAKCSDEIYYIPYPSYQLTGMKYYCQGYGFLEKSDTVNIEQIGE